MILPSMYYGTGTIVTVLLVRRLWCLYRNWTQVRKLPFPYVIAPWSDNVVIWRIMAPKLEKIFGRRLRFIQPELYWHEKGRMFETMGSDIFAVVSPHDIKMMTRDAEITRDICAHSNEWMKPAINYKPFELFGRNILSTEGSIWRRQKKVIATAFAEKNNEVVWTSATQQASAMVPSWENTPTETDEGFHKTLRSDVHTAATNVISWAAFGQKSIWARPAASRISHAKAQNKKEAFESQEYTLPVIDTVQLVAQNLLPILAAPIWLLRYFSPKYEQLARALHEFPLRVKDTIEQRRSHIQAKTIGIPGLLLDEMIKATAGSSPENQAKHEFGAAPFLTEEELTGNVYLTCQLTFYVAGMDTTSRVVEFALYCLAVYPEWQTKLQQQIDDYKTSIDGKCVAEWSYSESKAFIYATAIMFESMRLYPVTQGVPKQAVTNNSSILWKGGRVVVPNQTRLTADTVSIHYSTEYWGSDALKFNPDRWIKSSEDSSIAKELFKPPKGTFLAFSEGNRACIGRTFAETEFKAILTTIFEAYSLELIQQMNPIKRRYETWTEAQQKTLKVMESSKSVLTFGMQELAPLRLVRRKKL